MMIKLIRWVRYSNTYDFNEPPPYYILDNKSGYDKSKVIEFLKGGYRTTLGVQEERLCVFGCGASVQGFEITDGEWGWSDELIHYVDHHYIDLPETFLLHMEKQGFVATLTDALKKIIETEPDVYLYSLENVECSVKCWSAWLNEKRSTVDEKRLIELKENIKPFVDLSSQNGIPDSWSPEN